MKEDLQLDYKTNNISFYFNSSNFKKFQTVEYQYLLDGYMDEWSVFSEKSLVSFSNLRFGNYIFNVRSKIGDTHFPRMLNLLNFQLKDRGMVLIL